MEGFSQGEADIWYLNGSNGIDFGSGTPRIKPGFRPAATDRGNQSIADQNGHLLFYTDGYTVYDRNNQPMPNGLGMLGGGYQILAVPQPGNTSLYYLFYIKPIISPTYQGHKFYYSIIDMSLHSGLGDVTNSKNILLRDSVTQKLGSAIHRNGSDIWIITHSFLGNTFYSYLLNNTGINNTPVTNVIGHDYEPPNAIQVGQIRNSPNGDKLVMANATDSVVNNKTTSSIEFFSFDNATAQMSNPIFMRGFSNGGGDYGLTGVEFSPNGRLVYAVSSGIDSATYYQFNVCDFTEQAVINSMIPINSAATLRQYNSYDLQLAPDGKIYSINYPLSILSAIPNPDIAGLGCGFTFNGFNTGNFNGFTLPYFSNAVIHSISKGRFNITNTCFGSSTNFSLNETVDSVKWNFGEISSGANDSSKLPAPSHTYLSTGSFTVTAIVYSSCYTDTLTKNLTIVAQGSKILINDTSLCNGDQLTLYTNIPGASLTWQDGSTNDSYTISNSGKYWVDADLLGCKISDTVNVTFNPIPTVFLGNDTTLCKGNTLVLSALNPGALYLWDDNSLQQTRSINGTGKYWVQVKLNGCSSSDTIVCNFVPAPAINLGNDTSLCAGQNLVLRPGSFANTTYLWNNNSTKDSLIVNQNGAYWVIASTNGCTAKDTINVVFNPLPTIHLGNDTAICEKSSLILGSPPTPGYNYLWQDGYTNSEYTVNTQGKFTLHITNQFNCSASDSINVLVKPLPFFSLGDDTVLCAGRSITLKTTITNATYSWSTSNTTNSLTVQTPGLYWLKVNKDGCVSSDTIAIDFKPAPSINLGNDTALCTGQTLLLNASNNNATYLWQDASTQPTYTVSKTGVYSVKVDIDGCDTSGTVSVHYLSKPIIELGNDTTLCIGEKITLNANSPLAEFEWQDGSNLSEYTVTQAGLYSVKVENSCGIATDSIKIDFQNCSCKFFVPNAFTPGKDGKNDLFRPKYQCLFSNYAMKIFNRWGQLIFASQKINDGWDGSFHGQLQPSGGYVWIITYKDELTGKPMSKSGTLILIR